MDRRKFWPESFRHGGHHIPFAPSANTSILMIQMDRPGAAFIGDIVRALIESQPLPEKILISSYAESADWDYLEALDSIVTALDIADRVAVYDAGNHLDYFRNIPTIIYSPWWLSKTAADFKVDPIPFEQRTFKFSCLNRIARAHRVKVVEEIIEHGILHEGLVSCGSGSKTYNFAAVCKPHLLHHFPLDPMQDVSDVNDRHTVDFIATTPNHQMMSSLINLVTETSYDRMGDFKECWTRGMVTEKTVKTYLSEQLPIWLAPVGFVGHQRDLGFDVFDDIVNHHYDGIEDPWQRIIAVAAELKKLVSMPLDELQTLLKNNQHRFHHNRNHVKQCAKLEIANSAEKLKNWLGMSNPVK